MAGSRESPIFWFATPPTPHFHLFVIRKKSTINTVRRTGSLQIACPNGVPAYPFFCFSAHSGPSLVVKNGPWARFPLTELKAALACVQNGRSPWPAGIYKRQPEEFPPLGILEWLELLNRIWLAEAIPQNWGYASAVPLLKPGKIRLILHRVGQSALIHAYPNSWGVWCLAGCNAFGNCANANLSAGRVLTRK